MDKYCSEETFPADLVGHCAGAGDSRRLGFHGTSTPVWRRRPDSGSRIKVAMFKCNLDIARSWPLRFNQPTTCARKGRGWGSRRIDLEGAETTTSGPGTSTRRCGATINDDGRMPVYWLQCIGCDVDDPGEIPWYSVHMKQQINKQAPCLSFALIQTLACHGWLPFPGGAALGTRRHRP